VTTPQLESAAPTTPGASTGRKFAIGCLTAIFGALSGGMFAVLVSKLVAFMTKAPTCTGIPTCNWYLYWAVGAVVGAVSLSALSVWAVSKPKRTDTK
jgi:hypothetical protein